MNEKFKNFAKGKPKQEEEIGGYCVIYNRVSSKDQKDGQSLEVQMEKCEQYALELGLTVLQRFGGTYESAKSDDERKEFNRMLKYFDTSTKNIKAVIVYSISRFSRTGSTRIVEEIEKRGAYVYSTMSKTNPKTATGKFIQNMELAQARFENDNKRNVTIDNSIAALKKGRWIAKPPRGYNQKTTKKEQIITPNDEAEKIKLAFEWKVYQNLTNEEIRHKLHLIGFDICKQKLSDLFKNPFYCGYMSHTYLNGEVVKGNHPAIVSEDVFFKANQRLNESHANGYEVKMNKPEVPLIGTLKCPYCGKNMTSSISTKMKKKYGKEIHYYVCCNKGCKQNNSAKIVHESYEKIIQGYGLSNDLTELLKIQMKKTFDYYNKENYEQAKLLKRKKIEIQEKIKIIEDNLALAADHRERQVCKRKLDEFDVMNEKIESELNQIESFTLNLPDYINYGIKMKNNLLNIWQLAEIGEKKKIQNIVYPDGIFFNKKEGHIEPLSVNKFIEISPYDSACNDNKKNETNDSLYHLSRYVPEAGLEPAQP